MAAGLERLAAGFERLAVGFERLVAGLERLAVGLEEEVLENVLPAAAPPPRADDMHRMVAQAEGGGGGDGPGSGEVGGEAPEDDAGRRLSADGIG